MIYNDLFSIDLLDSSGNNILSDFTKFISLEVTYRINKFPTLELTLYSLQRLDISLTDIVIKLKYSDYFYNFNMGILEAKYTGSGIYEFVGVNLPYKFLAQNRTRFLSSDLSSAFNSIGTSYILNVNTKIKSNFYQFNETDYSILTYLISGISEGIPLIVTDKSIELMNMNKKESILSSTDTGNIILRNKFLPSNISTTKYDNYVLYQGLDEILYVNKDSQSEFYNNRLYNKQFEEGLTRISLLLNYDTTSPKKNVGDRVSIPGAYKNNLMYTITGKVEIFSQQSIKTSLIAGANEI